MIEYEETLICFEICTTNEHNAPWQNEYTCFLCHNAWNTYNELVPKHIDTFINEPIQHNDDEHDMEWVSLFMVGLKITNICILVNNFFVMKQPRNSSMDMRKQDWDQVF